MTTTMPVPSTAPRPQTSAAPAPPTARRSFFAARVLRGRPEDPAWARPGLLVLLVATAALYLWGLGASGWANSFYSAAVQAGSASWKAFFFGSSDAANSITVDKTPASLWAMALSARIFGVNAWSILVPQALEGVVAVGLLYAAVRRWFGPAAGLLAGAVLALTPVAVLMFRFNNPDALLTLLMVAGAYAVVRAVERGSVWWLALAGASVGFGFLTKMLQALLVVPAFALVYLVAAPPKVLRRLGHLLVAGAAMVVCAGWWVAIVELIPASARPYVGGSQSNSILELTLGYNGLGRITGNEAGSVGGGGAQGGRWGTTGWSRLFDAAQGGQIAWLLPAALILLLAGLVVTARRPRTDRARAGFLLWGGWLLITGLVFSFMQGIFHAYYTVALAPAVGALVGMGAVTLWRRRRHPAAAVTLAATTAVTAIWAYVLLGRSADWHPWLHTTVLVGGLAAALGLIAAGRVPGRLAGLAASVAMVAALAAPGAYSLSTAATAHTGAIPTAGPAVRGGFGGPGGGGPGGGGPGGGGPAGGGLRGRGNGQPPNGGANGGAFPGGAQGGLPGGAMPGGGMPGGPNGGANSGANGGTNGGIGGPGGAPGGPGGGPGGGGMGGLLGSRTPDAELRAVLENNAGAYTWAAAAVGSNNAAGLQLATGDPVMPIGGFNGSDPSPTLAQFQQYVADGKIHYFVGGSGFRSDGGSGVGSQIASWVAENFTATTVGSSTVYDLTTG